MLREKLDELPRDKEIIAFCKISLRGYEAQKILDAACFENANSWMAVFLPGPTRSDIRKYDRRQCAKLLV